MGALTIRILLAEDRSDDAELQVRELRRAGLRVTHRVVDAADAYLKAIREFGPDVILSDFSMPHFDGMEALRLAREEAPEIPFIFVSGTLGEDYAIRALKNGATDYVVKTNLARLPVAIERAISEAQVMREQRRAQAALEISQQQVRERDAALRRAQAMAKLAHVITDAGGRFESWSETLPDLIGLDPSHMPRTVRDWLAKLDRNDRELFQAKIVGAARTGERVDVEYRLERGDGAWINVRQVAEPLQAKGEAGENPRWFNTLQDITEQKRAEAKIRRLNRVHGVLSGINSLIVREPSREELFAEACRIAVEVGGFRMAWIGVFDRQAKAIKPAACRGHEAGFLNLMALAMDDPAAEGRGLVRKAVREKRAVILNHIAGEEKFRLKAQALERGYQSAAALPLSMAGDVLGVLGLFAAEPHYFDDEEMRLLTELAGDIAFALDHIAKVEKLDYLAYYDALTGLANRKLLRERLSQYVETAGRTNAKLALIVSNVERMAAVNESLGRQTGDLLLAKLAERLTVTVGDAKQIARLGGDNFAIVLPNTKSALDAVHVLGDLAKRALGESFQLGQSELRVSARTGLALFPDHGSDADTLLKCAEAALTRCKRSGERHLFFDQSMTERVATDLALENALRRALEREEFVLHYQPRVDLVTRRITGAEALIRWQREDGLVPPMKFIPLLEQTGLILEAGAWALRQAVLDHKNWLAQGVPMPRLAVNVSAVQLKRRDFVQSVARAIGAGAKPPGVDIEITESMAMDDVAGNIEKLRAVRELGINVAIDDFGTGYSSLAYLARLPVSSLKIDRSFVITMLADRNTMTLVSTIISLAHSLGLKVVAEGVDAEEQAAALQRMGCDEMQGYLYSKPLPPEAFAALLKSEVRT
jgi:diguanylate cyclase (GGDEF)-like protein/PAS domain S-box-containing protein